MIDIPYCLLVISTVIIIDKVCTEIEKKFNI